LDRNPRRSIYEEVVHDIWKLRWMDDGKSVVIVVEQCSWYAVGDAGVAVIVTIERNLHVWRTELDIRRKR